MLGMDRVHVIRHKGNDEGLSIRQIARDLGVSRNTVRKYVGDGGEPRRRASPQRPRPVLVQLAAGEHVAGTRIVHGNREPLAPAVDDARLELVGGRHQQRPQIELDPATTGQSPTPRERAPIGGRSPHPHLRVRRLARGSYLQRVAPSRIERQRCVGPRWRSSVEADAERSVIHVSPRPLHQGAHPERVQGVRQLGIRPGRASPRPGSSEAFAFRPGTPELHAAPEGPPQRYRVQPCELLYDSPTAPVSEWAPRSVLPCHGR